MAEIHKIVCDVCGRTVEDGVVLKPSARRRISHGNATRGAYRFDICDECFGRIQRECRAAAGKGSGG